MTSPPQDHWQAVYQKPLSELSWTRPRLDTSLALLFRHGLAVNQALIDVGAGASTLVDDLLAAGVLQVTCLDWSKAALTQVQQRLGERAQSVRFIVDSVTTAALPAAAFDAWHDRAVAHFLTDPADQSAYRQQLQHALKPGGLAIIAGFAPDGPERCSGLPVVRRDEQALWDLVGREAFTLLEHCRERHLTPGGREQPFCYAIFRRR